MLNGSNCVPAQYVKELMESAKFQSYTFFGNTTVLAAHFPNGFTIVESSGCIDPANYDLKVGKELCMGKIEDRLWQLLGWEGANEFSKKAPKKEEKEKPTPKPKKTKK